MSEKRLIDANALLREFDREHKNLGDEYQRGLGYAAGIALAFPTIDAVEVVRCGVCRHGKDDKVNHGYGAPYRVDCRALNRLMYENDFCSYGERKEAADEK